MPASDKNTLISDAELDELSRHGQTIYKEKLKALLEPGHNDEYVAVHVDTGDYAVGRTFREVKQKMLSRHPIDGRLVVMKIGPEPEDDALAARILLSEMKAARQK